MEITLEKPKTLPILLVEDNRGDARLVQEMLNDAPTTEFEVSHVERLTDAREKIMESGTGCVLLDLSLPDAMRLEALMQLRAAAPDVPIVILSGLQDELLAVKAVQEGAQDYLIKGRVDGALLGRSINYAIERKRAEMELAHQAMHDGLTGLPNRTLFMDRLKHAIARADRHEALVGVMFLDLDGFKLINDSLGHDAGDRLLAALADRLREVLRTSDTAARFGGDEFTLVCEDVSSESDVIHIAERILSAVDAPFELENERLFVTASMGIVTTEGRDEDAESLIRDADAAMYRAKERGASWELFDDGMRSRMKERMGAETALRKAVAREELRILYQPQVDIRTGEIFGVEALLRWDHPERGLIEPDEFIWLAEETGTITEIGAWMMEQVCLQASRWRAVSLDGSVPQIAVNLSGRQHRDPNLVTIVKRALEESGTEPSTLCLEINESVVMKDVDSALDTLRSLKDLGVKLSIDNFGTGYSSLSCLKRFPVDMLKVDRSFVAGLGHDPEDAAIVAAVISLANSLGLLVIAEGVETAAQAAELRVMGGHAGQGFYYGRPRPSEAIAALLGGSLRAAATG
jgi:diguanylate cyclase (GGDEF)-like protein